MKVFNVSRFLICVIASSACATAGTGGGATTSGTTTPPASQQVTPAAIRWPVKTREHVDLWLHGFAMLQADTALVPYFRRGYVSEMQSLRSRANATTQLDANRDRLRSRLAINAGLINAQFLPFY